MSDVVKRTVFYDDSDGVYRFHDWALVVVAGSSSDTAAPLGVMMEPFTVGIGTKADRNSVAGVVNYDAKNAGCRIDEIKPHSLDKGLQILGETWCGGYLMPRDGR